MAGTKFEPDGKDELSESLWTLRLMVRVPSNKRQEVIQALSSFVAEAPLKPFRRLILQDLSDDSLICWMGDWHSREALSQFLGSQTYHAIKGAAQVLGQLEEVRFVECPSAPASGSSTEWEH